MTVEPTVTLPSGLVVHQAIVDSINSVRSSGHQIAIKNYEIVIEPELDYPDVIAFLNMHFDDVRAILDPANRPRVH